MAPSQRYYCSTMDSMLPPLIQNWVLCFPCDTSKLDRISSILQTAFRNTILQRPYLAGRLSRETAGSKVGRFKLDCQEEDARVHNRLSINDLREKPELWRYSYEELRQLGMPVAQLSPTLLAPPGGNERLKSYPFAAQANFIAGGCLLHVCLNHSFVDGLGGCMIVESWAQNCKSLQEGTIPRPQQLQTLAVESSQAEDAMKPLQISLPNVLQDGSAPNAQELERIKDDPIPWQLLGLQKPVAEPSNAWGLPSEKVRVSAIFAASPEAIRRLMTETYECSGAQVRGQEASPSISSFDAIATLIWRCVMRARYSDLEGAAKSCSRLRVPINLRRTLDIAPDYPGNVLLNCLTETAMDILMGKANQGQIARKFRSSLHFTRDLNHVMDAIKLSFALPDIALRRPLFSDATGKDLVLTSWQDLTYYKHDWGPMFGSSHNVEFFRIPHGSLRGICALQPRRANQMVEIMINLEEAQMDRLKHDTDFSEYFHLVSA